MSTNITGLPQTGFQNLTVARIAKRAIQSLKTDPILLRFMMNDQGFNRMLNQSFDKGDVANIPVAPKLVGKLSSNINDNVDYQNTAFENIPVTLDNIAYVAFQYRDINEAISDVNIADTLGVEAGITLVETMYNNVISKMASSSYIAADQVVGTAGKPLNFALLRRLRTTLEVQFKIPRTDKIILVVNPYQYEALQGDQTFQYTLTEDSSLIRTGIFNTVLNMEIYSDPNFSNNGGGSQSISGSANAVGMAFVADSAVLPTRNLTLSDPSRQMRLTVDGVAGLWTSSYDASKVGGLMVQNKLETLFGFQHIGVRRADTGNINAKTLIIRGGL